jgi:hypothetical protein
MKGSRLMLIKRVFCILLIAGMIVFFATAAQAESDGQTIVGSWLATAGNGHRIIATFNSDGNAQNSVQSEVSSTEVLTPLHGVWERLPDHQFGVTLLGIVYNISTGELTGYLKVRVLLTIDEHGDKMIGTDKVQVLDPSGNVVVTFPSANTPYERIKFEPFN